MQSQLASTLLLLPDVKDFPSSPCLHCGHKRNTSLLVRSKIAENILHGSRANKSRLSLPPIVYPTRDTLYFVALDHSSPQSEQADAVMDRNPIKVFKKIIHPVDITNDVNEFFIWVHPLL